MKSRRQFLTQLALAATVFPELSAAVKRQDSLKKRNTQYHLFIPENGTHLTVPEGKRTPFASDYFSIDREGALLRISPSKVRSGSTISLRLQVAIGSRERSEVEVFLAASGKKVGHLSIWNPATLQIFEVELDSPTAVVLHQGVIVRLVDGKMPLYLMAPTPENGSHFLTFQNHGKYDSDRWVNQLYSLRSAQPFGWQEGCVLDGLQELYARKSDQKALDALNKHFDAYLRPNGDLIYESPASVPLDNRIHNLEAGLPFAVIAIHRPEHPSISLFMDYCKSRVDGKGKVKDNFLSTEGFYTVAYPLAVVARETKQPALYDLVLAELEVRIKYLSDEGAIYTRGKQDQSQKTYRNWGRGYCWFLLGLVRCGEILQNEPQYRDDKRLVHLKETFQYYCKLALSLQLRDHGWRAYLDLPETGYDCSATAGIGAALAHGRRIGWLTDISENQLVQIRERVRKSLTPDGFLKEICQHNTGGEALQKSEYRVIAQYVLGLLAQI